MTVHDSRRDSDADVWVTTPPDASTADVLRAALSASGSSDTTSDTPTDEGTPTASDDPVISSGLRDGVVVTSDGSGRAVAIDVAEPPSVQWRLVVLEGPGAGATFDLADGEHDVGRGRASSLLIPDEELSRRHFALLVSPAAVAVRDLGSTNGTHVGQAEIGRSWVSLPEGASLSAGLGTFAVQRAGIEHAMIAPDGTGSFVLNRRFRIRPDDTATTIDFPAPPTETARRAFPWVATLVPLVAAVALAVVLKQPTFLLFAVFSPITLVASQWSDRRATSTQKAGSAATFAARRTAADQRYAEARMREALRLTSSYPSAGEVVSIVGTPEARLWERRPHDDDFLGLRLGLGPRPSHVVVRIPEGAPGVDGVIAHAPIVVDLRSSGVLGLAGPTAVTTALAGWMVMQVAALHSPEDVRVVVVAPGATQADWGFLRWLPHAVDQGSGTTLIGRDDATVDARVRELTALVEERAARRRDGGAQPELVLPAVLVVLDGASALRRRPAVAALLQRGPACGVFFVCTDTDSRLVPEECRAVAVVEPAGTLRLQATGAPPVDGVAPDVFDVAAAERAARTIAALHRVAGEDTSSLPVSARLLDLLGTPAPDPEAIRSGWRANSSSSRVMIGAAADGPFHLDIERDGPHILVAGTTGSGKSEFLQTLVSSLALANAPEELSFLFVDFKGGAAFRAFAALPHTVGFVTNLDGGLVQRALAALRAELDRRQRQLIAAGVEDVSEYLRRRVQNPTMAAFPRLVILIDEFAEMKEQLPDFIDGLVGIARVGRSLGVHLVLATQRPHGVVSPEIRANANLRICLRVREDADSIDVLDSPVAASIPRTCPGRGYGSIGGESLRAFQSGRVGGRSPGSATTTAPQAWPARWEQIGTARPRPASGVLETTDMEIIVAAVAAAAHADGREAPYRPWTAPLPVMVDLDQLRPEEDAEQGLVVGLQDLPQQQRQVPWRLRLADGHLAVVGSARSGRTTALRTIAASLATAYDVSDAHLWAIDGGVGLNVLSGLPHCGVVASVADSARVDRLLERLEVEVTRRLRSFAAQGYSSLDEQRAGAEPADRLPYLLLLVDRWETFTEAYAGTPTEDKLTHLLNDGTTAGLTVVVAGDESLLRGRILARLPHRLLLRLNDPGNAVLAGLDPRQLAEGGAGRGVSDDGSLIQVAMLGTDPSGPAQNQALRELVATACARDASHEQDARRPFLVRELPDTITTSQLPAVANGIALGVCGDDVDTAVVDPRRDGLLVVGPSRSGRSTALVSAALGLASSGSDVIVVGGGPAWSSAAEVGSIRLLDDEAVRGTDWRSLLHAATGPVVIVDDLDRVDHGPLLDALAGTPKGRLLASASLDSYAVPSQPLMAVLRSSSTTLLLCPPSHLSAGHVNVRIDRTQTFKGPPGRGILRQRGEQVLVQVATPG